MPAWATISTCRRQLETACPTCDIMRKMTAPPQGGSIRPIVEIERLLLGTLEKCQRPGIGRDRGQTGPVMLGVRTIDRDRSRGLIDRPMRRRLGCRRQAPVPPSSAPNPKFAYTVPHVRW